MAIEYATTLRASSVLGPNEQIDRIADAVGRWARVPDPISDADRVGRRGSNVTTKVSGDQTAEHWAWTLELRHPDDRDTAVEWVVLVAALRDGDDVEVTITLERRRTDGAVLRHRERSAPPGCIRALLDLEDPVFLDAGRRLATNVWLVEPEDATDLARTILDPTRKLPVFGLTPRDEDPIDGGEFLTSVAGLAHVALIRPRTSWALDDLLPRGLNVYGGAARLWWPGVTSTSSRWDHELWAGDKRAEVLQRQATDLIVEAGLAAATGIDPRILRLERQEQDAEAERLAERVEELRARYEEALEEAAASREVDTSAELARAGDELRAAEEEEKRALRADRDAALDMAVTAEADAKEARDRASVAERERDYLRSEVVRLQQALAKRGTSDAGGEDELREEIEEQVRSIGDVDGARPRAFALGPAFAANLAQHGERYRSKAVKACAYLATGAPGLLQGLDDHPLRSGDGANDPQKTRGSDGARARRCNIEQNTPAARRLHYWVLEDGSIELASVNVHDDMAIPE